MSGVLTSMVGVNSGYSITTTVNEDTANFNARNALQSAGWDGVSSVNGTVIVNDGVTLYSDNGSPAFTTGDALPDGSTLRLINRGLIVGKGGDSYFQARKPFAVAGRAWRFEGVVDGWTATRQTAYARNFNGQGTLLLSGGDSDPQFISPNSLGVAGGTHQYVRVRIRRAATTAGDWQGRCFFQTSGHGFSSSYFKDVSATLPVGEWVTLEWDMWNLTQGGDDWKNSNIIRIRLDFNAQYGDFEIDWITIGEISDWSPEWEVDGNKGGNAIDLSMPIIIDNTNGYIYSGGGAGGSVMVTDINVGQVVRWAGAGGGQGRDGGHGGITGTTDETGQSSSDDGGDGSMSMAGTGGVHASTTTDYGFTQINGGGGGVWGEAGADASTSYVSGIETLLGVGGEPGLAIKTNSHEVSWIGGNNETRVKGLIE